MKTRFTIILLVSLFSFTMTRQAEAQKVKLVTAEDSLSYALGVANFEYYKKDSVNLNTRAFSKGMTDSQKGKALMDEKTAGDFVVKYMQARETKQREKEFRVQIDGGKKFLAENAAKEGVRVTSSGLQYKVITEGSGEKPGPDDVVKINYLGTTIDGSKFDSSYDRNEPAEFKLSNVISGFREGLQLMPAGSKYILYLPYKLAYGERGAGSIIKPFETLIFEVELIEIVKE